MTLADGRFLAERHVRLRASLEESGLDALVVTHLPNIFYLTNFRGSAGIVVLTRDALKIVTDFRYFSAVESLLAASPACAGETLVRVNRSYDEDLVDLLQTLHLSRIGFEAECLPVARYRSLAGRLKGAELVATDGLIERMRLVKDAHEIAALRRGAELLSTVARTLAPEVVAGRTERDVAMRIDWTLREVGFEGPAFETIVASGPNGALPHARPGGRRIGPSDLVVLDFGGVYDGYCVDLTRTVAIGAVDQESARVHAAVAEAQAAAIAAVRPGALSSTVDAAARDTLARHDLADAFGHSTGHGLGIEVHEAPRIARRRAESPASADTVLQPGMVFTIEPGAYLPGWGGVRIEDDVLVTADGADVLTDVPRGLRLEPQVSL